MSRQHEWDRYLGRRRPWIKGDGGWQDTVWLVVFLVACTAVLLVVVLSGPVGETGPGTGACQEDMKCWDCRTMGNRICGPGHGND